MINIYAALCGAFAMTKEYGNSFRPMVMNAVKGINPTKSELKAMRIEVEKLCGTQYGYKAQAGSDVISFHSRIEPDKVPAGSIALIRVSGYISANGGWCSKGLSDYTNEMIAAGTNKNIKGVILQVNSCGGSVEGVENFSNFVAAFQGKYGKPLAALIDAKADSAGYYALCQAPRIFVNGESTEAGSIGTMVTLMDYSAMMEAEGIKEIIINATRSVNKNKDYQDALDGNTAGMVAWLDKYNNIFLKTVQRGRPQLNKAITVTTNDAAGNAITFPEVLSGKIYVGNEILTMGLADEISDLDGVVRYIESRAMQMGLGNGASTVVQTETAEEEAIDEYEDDFSYNQQKLNITMFKNLSTEILQGQFKAAQTALNTIATEKGYNSKEFQSKSNEIAMMEMELINRDLQAKFDAVKGDFKIAQSALTEKETEITALNEKLKVANEAVNSTATEKVNALEAEKTALQTEKEKLTAELTAAQNEKAALEAAKNETEKELTAHREFLDKQGVVLPTTVVAAGSHVEGSQPEGHKQPIVPVSNLSPKEQAMAAMRDFQDEQDRKAKKG